MAEQLTIGELADRTGVATSALRYWEEVGLLPPPARVSGHRRYPPSAVGLVGVVVLLQEAGFALREIKVFLLARSRDGDSWRELYRDKLTELDRRIARAQAARTAIAQAVACPHDDLFACPNFTRTVADRLTAHRGP